MLKTLRYGRIYFRGIHCFEILKFELHSLFYFFVQQFPRYCTYTELIQPTRTLHATCAHKRHVTHPFGRVMRRSKKKINDSVRAILPKIIIQTFNY